MLAHGSASNWFIDTKNPSSTSLLRFLFSISGETINLRTTYISTTYKVSVNFQIQLGVGRPKRQAKLIFNSDNIKTLSRFSGIVGVSKTETAPVLQSASIKIVDFPQPFPRFILVTDKWSRLVSLGKNYSLHTRTNSLLTCWSNCELWKLLTISHRMFSYCLHRIVEFCFAISLTFSYRIYWWWNKKRPM